MKRMMTAFIVLGAVLGAGSAAIAQEHEFAKLLPTNGVAGDEFGMSVAIEGTTAIVGAWKHGGTGSAYLFDLSGGQQIGELMPSDAPDEGLFGLDVAIAGSVAVVGAPHATSPFGEITGAVYVFDIVTGQQIAKLLPDGLGADSYFGGSVAIRGTAVLVGAPRAVVDGVQTGAAYLFDAMTGQEVGMLVAEDAGEGDIFGVAVAVDGAAMIIGAAGDDDAASNAGAAYVFDAVSGVQLAKLVTSDARVDDYFGVAVAMDGVMAVVGTENHDDNGEASGAAYLFDIATGRQTAELLPEDGASRDHFGWSVAIEGTTVLVGAHLADAQGGTSGAAYLFDVTTGQQTARLLASDGDAGDNCGQSAAMSGGIAIVGAHWDDPNGSRSGSAYLFAVGGCRVDLNEDGDVDTRDFVAFLNAWAHGEQPADWNADGAIDAQDFIAYLNEWVAGC